MHPALYLHFFLVAWSIDLSLGLSCVQCNTLELPLNQSKKYDDNHNRIYLTPEERGYRQDCMYGNLKPTPCEDATANNEADTCDAEIVYAQAKLNLTAVVDASVDEDYQCGTIVVQNQKHNVGVIRFCTHEHLNVLFICKKVKNHPLISDVLVCDTCDKDGCNNANLSNGRDIRTYAAVSLMHIKARSDGSPCGCGDPNTTSVAPGVQFSKAQSSLLSILFQFLCAYSFSAIS